MLLRRFYDTQLAQASYLIGCGATGEAIVIDPNRDVEQYVRAAADEGVRISRVTETHIHADFVSGGRELAHVTGAQLMLSDEGGADWKYAFASASGATSLYGGDTFMVGNLRFGVVHTPGHTPEHISFMVTDTPATNRPMGVVTGDFVFAGDVGRPDLLEKAAGQAGTMESAARTLFHSLQWFRGLPDYLQVWPGHGAGSACGKALGAVPFSTVGYEKIANWALAIDDENEFVRMVLAGQPEPPRYFAQMKRINKQGPGIIGGFSRPQRLSELRLNELMAAGAIVVDTRDAVEYAASYVPGSINIPLNRSFTTWAGSLVPYDRDLYLIVADRSGRSTDDSIDEAIRDLAMIGLDRVAGYFGADVVDAWHRLTGNELGTTPQVSAPELAEQLGEGGAAVLDVRSRSEWDAGHIQGARHIPLGALADRMHELPRDGRLIVHCQGGARSAIAASLLRSRGMDNVANLSGGYVEWQKHQNSERNSRHDPEQDSSAGQAREGYPP